MQSIELYSFLNRYLSRIPIMQMACFQREREITISCEVEGYVFSDSGFGYPLFQGMMSHGSGQAFEYFSGAPFATQLQCFLTDREGGLGFCLFGADTDVVALIRTDLKVTPVQLQNITDTETGHASK